MSSPSQSDFEDYIDRDYNNNEFEQEEYENYINNLHNEPVGINDIERFVRKFEGYNEIIEMITYINEDIDHIKKIKGDVMDAIESLIKRREEMIAENNDFCSQCFSGKGHKCVKFECNCKCCTSRLVSEQNKIKKGKEIIDEQGSSSRNNYDRLQGINLPYDPTDNIDIYEYTSGGIIQLEICLIHYKTQIETSLLIELEKEKDENKKEILEQLYTMLQKS